MAHVTPLSRGDTFLIRSSASKRSPRFRLRAVAVTPPDERRGVV